MSLLSPEPRVALLARGAALALGRATPIVEEACADPLDALAALLDRVSARGRVRVVLSHEHVRMHRLSAPSVRLRAREIQPWIRAQLAESLGAEDIGAWRFTWDDAPPGQPILVAAARVALLDGLSATLQRHGLRRGAVVPWLTAAWARNPGLGRADCWFASMTPERLALLRIERGHPALIRQRAVGGDGVAALTALLTRESTLAETDPPADLWLETAGVTADWAPLRARHRVKLLAAYDADAQAMLA